MPGDVGHGLPGAGEAGTPVHAAPPQRRMCLAQAEGSLTNRKMRLPPTHGAHLTQQSLEPLLVGLQHTPHLGPRAGRSRSPSCRAGKATRGSGSPGRTALDLNYFHLILGNSEKPEVTIYAPAGTGEQAAT